MRVIYKKTLNYLKVHKALWVSIIIFVMGVSGFLVYGFSVKNSQLAATVEPVIGETKKAEASLFSEKNEIAKPKGNAFKKNGVPVLMYHHVGELPESPDSVRKSLTVSVTDFESQVKWLREQGYNTVTLEQLYLYTQKQFVLPSKPIVFSFDDGYEDVFVNAVPVLTSHGFVGSFAIISDFAGKEGYASWQQITDAQNLGMEIVSHTSDHFDGHDTKKYNEDFVYNNLIKSKAVLAEHGITTRILIYPFGHFTENYIKQAKRAGFVMGLTVSYGTIIPADNLMQSPRIRVSGGQSLERFIELLNGRLVKTVPAPQSPLKAE